MIILTNRDGEKIGIDEDDISQISPNGREYGYTFVSMKNGRWNVVRETPENIAELINQLKYGKEIGQ